MAAINLRLCLPLAIVALLACNGQPQIEEAPPPRPDSWAVPVSDQPGLSNLFKLSDALYRGAQPDDVGFASLKQLGVRSVINLRTFHSDRSECKQNGLKYFHITMQAWEGEDEELVEFLRVVADPGNQPVFVHCMHGADRTGVVSAVYRMAIQGWSKEDAIEEMTEGGYGFHHVWQNLIDYVEALDVERIRAQAGMAGDRQEQES
jgi:protein tyrosine/serine phosphatase